MRTAMNEVLRDWYVGDCQAGVERWNRILERHGMSRSARLPDRKFNRGIGMFSSLHFDPHGVPLSDEEWERRRHEWLPSPPDREYLLSIMAEPVYEPGSSPTTSRRRCAASISCRSTSSTCGRSRDRGRELAPRFAWRVPRRSAATSNSSRVQKVRRAVQPLSDGTVFGHGRPEQPHILMSFPTHKTASR